MAEHPFLILTLRRTGGTQFMRMLQRASRFPTVEHEPFNRDRLFGEITRKLGKSGKAEERKDAIREALADKPNIKHCVEIVPEHLTASLIDVCQELDYRFLVLTRQNESARLLSLFVAKASGAWGSQTAGKIYPDIQAGQVVLEAVVLDDVKYQYTHDRAALGSMLTFLRGRELPYHWMTYEDLYVDGGFERQFRATAEMLEIEDSEKHLEPSAKGERTAQGSGSIANYLPNIDDLRAYLDTLPT